MLFLNAKHKRKQCEAFEHFSAFFFFFVRVLKQRPGLRVDAANRFNA